MDLTVLEIDSAVMVGFTLTNGSAFYNGGGVYCESTSAVLSNCVLSGNWGGGAYGGMLNNCALTGNWAPEGGGGGAAGCTLNNRIVYFNTATTGGNNYYPGQYDGMQLTCCCTTPMPTNGVGNITNAPLFVDQSSGNLRLQSNSPCIHSGNNAYVVGSTDLDGNPRIVGGTVDIGAYDFLSFCVKHEREA
jgi:hypothetical protein